MEPRFEKITRNPQLSYTCYIRKEPTYPFEWHYHPEYELTAILKSKGKRFVGDNISDYKNGDLVLLGPNIPHTWQSTESADTNKPCEAVVVQFSHDFMGESFLDKPETKHIQTMLKSSNEGIQFTGETQHLIVEKMKTLPELNNFEMLIELLSILDTLTQAPEKNVLSGKVFKVSSMGKIKGRFNKIYKFIHENYDKDIKQEDVASLINMSNSSFSRFFRKVGKKSFTGYVNELRVSKACNLLIETDKNITDICFESGFKNLSNFNRQFLKLKNMNPREFRKEFLKHVV